MMLLEYKCKNKEVPKMENVENKVVIITGATSGIGEAN